MDSFDSISLMPKMELAFAGWTSSITLKKITQTIVDGDRTETETNIIFDGVVQPLSVEQVNLKPEGQRSWKWLQIHALTGVNNLSVYDKIKYNDVEYKVMAINDYSLNNYVEYHIVKDYQ